MTFTYDNTLQDEISQVRNLIDDTDEDLVEFSDEEIMWFLETNLNDIYLAASEAAFRMYVKFSKLAKSASVDDIRLELSWNSTNMKNLALELKKLSAEKKRNKSGKAPLFFGGVDKAGFNRNREDFTVTPPDFTKDTIFFDRDFPTHTPIKPRKGG